MAVFAWSSIIILGVEDFVILLGFTEHLWIENDLAKDSDEIRTTVRKKLNIVAGELGLNIDLIDLIIRTMMFNYA